MVDIDLHNIQILTSQDVDLVEVSHVKEIESQNTYLKNGLIISTLLVVGFIVTTIILQNKKKKNIVLS